MRKYRNTSVIISKKHHLRYIKSYTTDIAIWKSYKIEPDKVKKFTSGNVTQLLLHSESLPDEDCRLIFQELRVGKT